MPITNIATLAVDIVVNARRAQGVLRNVQTSGNQTAAALNRTANSIQAIGLGASAFLLLRKAVQVVTDVVKESVLSFAKLEEHIVNIEKVAKTGNLSELSSAFFQLGEFVKGADFKEISEAMVVAARSGVRGAENIRSLAQAAVVLSEISLDISSDEATEGLAALAINLDLDIQKTDQLANAIDVLSDTTLATSGEILKTSARLSGFADSLGISAAEVTGLSAALLATKASATTVRTTLTRLFDVLISQPFEAAAAVGMTGQAMRQFAELTRTNAVEAVIQFVEAFDNLDVARQTEVLDDLELGSSRITQVMRNFAANTDNVRQAIKTSTQAIENSANSTQKLFLANQTASARITALTKDWEVFKASLLTAQPILDTITGLLKVFSESAGQFEIGVTTPGDTLEEVDKQIREIADRANEIRRRLPENTMSILSGSALAQDIGNLETAGLRGELERLQAQLNQLHAIRQELVNAEKEAEETRRQLTQAEKDALDAQEKANAEKFAETASDLTKAFEPDNLRKRIQAIQDQLAELRESFTGLATPTSEAAMAMREAHLAGMNLVRTLIDEDAAKKREKADRERERAADEARRERESVASGLAGFAGDFGSVVTTLSSVSELLKSVSPEAAGALGRVVFEDLFGPGERQEPRILSAQGAFQSRLTALDDRRGKMDAERLTLAKEMVKLLVEDKKDRETIIEILGAIEEKELTLK